MTLQPSALSHARIRELLDRGRNDVLDLALAGVRRLLAGDEAPAWAGAGANRLRPPVRLRMMPLLATFAGLRDEPFFVQIGSGDGRQQDPLHDMVMRHGWAGIIVEPLPSVFERLRRDYRQVGRIRFENVAVGLEDGSVDSLCRRHGVQTIDVLRTTTRGSDYEILKSVDFERLGPTLVIYEHAHLDHSDRASCAAHLEGLGYEMLADGLDTWCLNLSALTGREREALLLVWQWITAPERQQRPLSVTTRLRAAARRALGPDRPRLPEDVAPLFSLTDNERRYLERGYDDTAPLPPGVADSLSDDDTRLTELRARYAELDLPATHHHMWSPGRVAEHVTLRYFRGDNLYQWHYPEHPRAMALTLFVYMRYLASRGGEQLLDRLSEDGAFGCWTAEIDGYGKISRDLLDSVNEILFLERQLGVLDLEGLRVLDVGAGYGRLAYRMAAAHPSLGDYGCVDAVPESTFLSAYYLEYRGCSPPARVVPLDQVTALEPGSFDLAVNIHSFSECTLAAIGWWAKQLARLRVPYVFVVPNEAEGISSREVGGGYHDALPTLAAAGYRPTVVEPVITDPAVRELVRIHDNFYLFERADETG